MSQFQVYSLRLTVSKDDPSFLKKILDKYSNVYAYGFEISKDKVPHYHAYFEVSSQIKMASMRAYIRRELKSLNKLSGNKTYSLKKSKDKKKLLAYTIKDGKVFIKNIDPFFLQEAKDYDRKIKRDLSLKKLPRVARLMQQDDVIDSFSKNDTRGVLALICEDFANQNKGFQDHQVIGIFNTLEWQLKPSSRKDTISRLYQKVNYYK